MTPVNVKPIASKWTQAAVFAALLLGATALTSPAQASEIEKIWTEPEDDGSVTELWRDQEDGHVFAIFVYPDGYSFVFDPSNPNPEDTSSGPGSHSDKPDVIGLIKSGGATYRVRLAPADSPELMAHLKSALGNAGLGPRYNPSDDDNGHGHGDAPDHSMEVKKSPAEIRQEIAVANEIARRLATIGGAMGDGEEGGTESPTGPNKSGKGGSAGDDDADYSDGQDKDVGKTDKDLLGAKPEVVNPPHWERTGAGDHSAAGGGAGGGAAHGGAGHAGTATHG